MSKQEFIGYTVGLQAVHDNFAKPALVKVEFSRQADGRVTLAPVSGHNLSAINGVKRVVISADEYADSPEDNIERADWAFAKLGLTVAGRDAE